MRDKKESQKQKRIVKRQEKANTMLNKAVSSGNLKKEGRAIKKVKKLQTKYKDAGDAKRKVFKTNKDGIKSRQVIKDGSVKRSKVKIEDRDTGLSSKFKSTPKRSVDEVRDTKYHSKVKETPKRTVIKDRSKDTGYSYNLKSTPKRTVKVVTKDDGVKTRQVSKDGVVKKTVTRTPGGVEKEIERGNKRIEVQKYKDEGVKNRTVINMVKNSAFKNLPSSMVNEAMKPENNVMMNNKKK